MFAVQPVEIPAQRFDLFPVANRIESDVWPELAEAA